MAATHVLATGGKMTLETPIKDTELSVRTKNVLKKLGIDTVGDLTTGSGGTLFEGLSKADKDSVVALKKIAIELEKQTRACTDCIHAFLPPNQGLECRRFPKQVLIVPATPADIANGAGAVGARIMAIFPPADEACGEYKRKA